MVAGRKQVLSPQEDVMLIKTRVAAVLVAVAVSGGLMTAAAVSAQAADTHPQASVVHVAAQARGMNLQAGLRGSGAYPPVRGHSGYQSGWQGRHMQVALWNARRLAGRTLVVFVHGTRVGALRIGRGGWGGLSLGHGVPACSPGTVIRVRTRSGVLVASGTFRRMM
jgi:hypothetical protein